MLCNRHLPAIKSIYGFRPWFNWCRGGKAIRTAPSTLFSKRPQMSLDSFKCRKTLKVGTKTYAYYSLPVAEKNGLKGISRLPFSMKVVL